MTPEAEAFRHRLPPWDRMRDEFDAALAAERRLTVERIHERLWPDGFDGSEPLNPFDLDTLLDEVAGL